MTTPHGPDRRTFIGVGLGAFALAAVPAGRSLFGLRTRAARRSVPVMGTVAELVAVHPSEAHAHRALDAAIDALRRVDATMTRFRDDSDVGRVNSSAPGTAVTVSSETFRVVEEGIRWARLSDGAFDPALGRAAALWDPGRRTAPPEGAEVRRLAGGGLWRAVEVERGRSTPTIRLHDPRASLDLGGIAKGFGVDAAVRALEDYGVFRALVNAGGDLRAAGVAEDGEPWEVGVRDPEAPWAPGEPIRVVAILRVTDRAVATSGDYQQAFDHGGRRYHHLLDPVTGEPRWSGSRTLTVVAGECMAADAAATALFGARAGAAEKLLRASGTDAHIAHRG